MNKFLSNDAAERAILPLDVALYRACKDKHGSKAAIAEIHGFNSMVFSKCVDINHQNYHLHPEHIEAITSYTKDVRILESLAAAHGGVAIVEIPDFEKINPTTFLHKIGKLSQKVGRLAQSIDDSLLDGKICDVDLATIEKDVMQLVGAAMAVNKLARAKALLYSELNQPFHTPESLLDRE